MNNKENSLSMALKYIDKHSLLLPENTKTTMNAMFGVLAANNAAAPQPSYCRYSAPPSQSRCNCFRLRRDASANFILPH
jgi:hypothetical protein